MPLAGDTRGRFIIHQTDEIVCPVVFWHARNHRTPYPQARTMGPFKGTIQWAQRMSSPESCCFWRRGDRLHSDAVATASPSQRRPRIDTFNHIGGCMPPPYSV
ncbi:uncharacterized protein SEPMUDRAFT_118364 [Sphaerulina musiva SO2202]|uniref:Uncharacterized protein n=1 Tax=Sphaerulina musiva (strain SO2202) TaxID=692275 RepID=M3BUP2_SPHMS|nr:uncharacterized protein SEPMUDRAFT_118364 [Sphaerulina musiva SO2202]EMF11054.1 hypothetical protein SEPMUDRAFT_118364 [Sphaerulina musiva SO2202]